MAAQQELVALYRAGLKSSLELMKVPLENAERLQNQQLAALRAALEQSQSSGEPFQHLIGYWAGLYEAAGQNQVAALAQARAWLEEASKRASA